MRFKFECPVGTAGDGCEAADTNDTCGVGETPSGAFADGDRAFFA